MRGSRRQSARGPVPNGCPHGGPASTTLGAGPFLVFWFVPCFWPGRSTLKGVNFRPIRPLGGRRGPGDTRGQEPRRSFGHRFGRSSEAARQVASLHARSHGSCSHIGSFCDLVAAPAWVLAWVGAVGFVRNASPVRNDSILPNVGVIPCSTGTVVAAHLAAARHALLLCQGCVQASN